MFSNSKLDKGSFRFRWLSSFVVFFALILITKLFIVQILNGEAYSQRADNQYATPATGIFERGSIFFQKRDGQLISAATTISGFKLAIKPKEIINSEESFQQLKEIIPLEYENFISRANKKNDPYEEIANHLNKEQADKISELKISGTYLYKEKWRFYPGDSLASHLIGFLAYKGDDFSGRYGLERYYNDILSRKNDNLYVNFFAEIFAGIKKTLNTDEIKEGDIISTIEPSVQSFLEKKLQNLKEKWQGSAVGGIIINPMDGSIYAMAHSPDFNLNEFGKEKEVGIYSNPLVENVFEFGSVIKPLVMAGAFDMGAVNANTYYEDKGYVVVGGKTINNFDKKGHGRVNMQTVLSNSLNTGMVFTLGKMGKEKFREYLLSYEIDKKTGIDLPNETSGLVGNLNTNGEVEYANASFGQGIALTPIEAVKAFSALANGGYLIKPHIVKGVKYKDGSEKNFVFPQGKQVIKKETSAEISQVLTKIIDNDLAQGSYKMPSFSIAAKTGTAQIAKKDGGGYYEDRNLHSFFGYFPATDPKFLTFMFIAEPKEVKYASQTLADPFMEITKFLLSYYEISPDR